MTPEYQALVEQDGRRAAGKMTDAEYADIQRDRARLMIERDRALESADLAEQLREESLASMRELRLKRDIALQYLARLETKLGALQWGLALKPSLRTETIEAIADIDRIKRALT